jgi:branched-chain amino acid transport system permease protein
MAILAGALASMPGLIGPYYLLVLSSALALAIACMGISLLLGHAGLLSLGHAAYFGAGAYAGAFLFTFADLASLELYLLSGLIASTVLAAAAGALCVRATRIHFTILSLALAQILHSLVVSGAVFRPFRGGMRFFIIGNGGLYLRQFTIAGIALDPEAFNTVFYYVVVSFFLTALVVMRRIIRSPFGMSLRAIRDNPTRAACVGIRVRRYRWAAFVISGAFVALGGALSGQVDRQVTPQQLDWLLSARLVVATVIGGIQRPSGPVVGALALTAFREISLRFVLYHNLVLGGILVGVVLARRDALGPGSELRRSEEGAEQGG